MEEEIQKRIDEAKTMMQYVNLGNSGIKVSRFSYGNSNSWFKTEEGMQERANALVKRAWDLGITTFDTSETYYDGKGEELLGNALRNLKVPRSDFLVTSKVFWGKYETNINSVNNVGLSVKRIQEGVSRTLKNMKMDYVDIYFCHRYDFHTPTLEVVLAMKNLIAEGKVLYWAVSAWPPIRVMEAIMLCDQHRCPRPVTEQIGYSIYKRDTVEKDYFDLIDQFGLGCMTYSPLHSGILTGKYNNGIPEDSRFGARLVNFQGYYEDEKKKWLEGENGERTVAQLNKLAEIAEEIGATLAQFALAWVVANQNVNSCILGASRPNQLLENVESLKFVNKITPEVNKRVDEIVGNKPSQDWDMKVWKPRPDTR
jgi:voltage-dependent potassium channel beta subunit